MDRLFAWIVLVLASATTSHAGPPNVVLIVGDDQGMADYGFMKHPHIKTPHLDKLAAEGLTFSRGYVPTSLCRASLATMITGLYPHQHKITSNDPPLPKGLTGAAANRNADFLKQRQEMAAMIEKVPTLPRLLEKQGYISFQAGKWWEGNACRCGGFTEGMTHGDPSKGGRHGDEGLKIGREGLKPVLDFLDGAKAGQKPFFLWYAPMMPHQPHNPPARLLAKYKDKTPSIHVAKYWTMCEWFDESIGDLISQLDQNGQTKDTLIIYLHDNGWIQDPDSESYAPKSKRSPNDTGVRTPIILKWPGHIKAGTDDTPVNSIDLAPTILVAAGGKQTEAMEGINLLDAKSVTERPRVFGEIFEHNAVDIRDPAKNLQYRWVVQGNWKLIVPHAPNIRGELPELYDVVGDPEEKTNLAAGNPEKVAELTKRLDDWWKP